MRKLSLRLAALCAALLLLAGCAARRNDAPQGGQTPAPLPAADAALPALPVMPEALPADAAALAEGARETLSLSGAAELRFTENGAEVSGAGASASGGEVTVSEAGVYLVSGKTRAGRITVDAGEGDTVRLVFSGAEIAAQNGPALFVRQAGRVFLTLAADTQNTLADGADYAEAFDKANGCVYSEAPLFISGKGLLSITGLHKHGVSVKDRLVLADAALTVTAADDGLRGRGVAAFGASLTVTAGGDGIVSGKAEGALSGVILSECACSIRAAGDGVQSETSLHAENGALNVTSGGGAARGQGKGSAKGLKSGAALVITGGSLALDCADDALHAGGSIFFTEADAQLSSGDDALHADAGVAVFSGSITVARCNEGIEGARVDILGGALHITAANDALNAAVSGEETAESVPQTPVYIRIAGGAVFLDAAGDGVDSNGDLWITGGETLICGPTDNQNGALDYDGAARVSGGILAALGWKGMAKGLDADSQQAFLAVSVPAQQAGERLTLCDERGAAVLSLVPEKAYESIVLSAPALRAGGAYTLYTGGSLADAAEAQADGALFQTGAALKGGAKLGRYIAQGGATRAQ